MMCGTKVAHVSSTPDVEFSLCSQQALCKRHRCHLVIGCIAEPHEPGASWIYGCEGLDASAAHEFISIVFRESSLKKRASRADAQRLHDVDMGSKPMLVVMYGVSTVFVLN